MDIFWAAKAGNLEKVKELVDAQPDIVNERSFDATPLFYACLCGHYEVAKFLLNRGSLCAEDTFDGDRCLYGALTDKIRQLLKEFSQRRTFVLSQYAEEVYSLLTQRVEEADVVFEFSDGQVVRCHRFILAARVPMFAQKFRRGGRWFKYKGNIKVKSQANKGAFMSLLRYCYSDVLDCGFENAGDLINLCRRAGLPELARAIALEINLIMTKPSLRRSLTEGQNGSVDRKVIISKLHPLGRERMALDFGKAFVLMSDLADLRFRCVDQYFAVHSCMIKARSEHFRARLSPTNMESFRDTDVLSTHPPHVVHACLMFLYTDGTGVEDVLFEGEKPQQKQEKSGETEAERRDWETEQLAQLFDLGALFMLNNLCDFVSILLVRRDLLVAENVMDWLHFGVLHSHAKLQKTCFHVIGECLEKILVHPDDPLVVFRESYKSFTVDEFRLFLDQAKDVSERDFFIAEVREAFIESLPTWVDMEERNLVTDQMEELLGFQFTGEALKDEKLAALFS